MTAKLAPEMRDKWKPSVPRAVTVRRLLVLARFLEKLPPKRFDFEHWVGHGWKGAQDLSCGTTACALGWAATMPYFRRLGLRLTGIKAREVGELGQDVETYVRSGIVNPTLGVQGGDYNVYDASLEAAMVTFGLQHHEAHFVFCPNQGYWDKKGGQSYESPRGNATAKEVAAHIRRFVTVLPAR